MTSQTTPDSIQLGASFFETGFNTFIKLEDQVVQVGDIQGLCDFQITKLIFELWEFWISKRVNPRDDPEYLVFEEKA